MTMRIAVFVAALCATVSATKAATISVKTPNGSEGALVLIDGELLLNDYEQFRNKVSTISKAIVVFQSDGGIAIAGIEIGKLIRLRNFSTIVPRGKRCASACAIAWLGGTQRYMGTNAQIGFHAAYDPETGHENGAVNALVGAYLSQIGLPDLAVLYITKAAPTSMTWLSLADAKKVGIDVLMLKEPAAATGDDPPAPGFKPPTSGNYSVNQNVSAGILNMRSGPGVGHSIVVSIPAGSSNVALGICQRPDDGKSQYDWCQAAWNGYSGWLSKGGVADQSEASKSKVASELHRRSKEFIAGLYRVLSGPTDEVTATLNKLYADTVTYFGNEMSRDEVITKVQRFLARWPSRQYKPKEGSVIIDCNDEVLACSVSGVMQFDSRSPIRNEQVTGEATFEYRLRFSSSYQEIPTIVAEDGKVIERRVEVLPSVIDGPPLSFFGHR